jgi:radial spoke head protein 3
MSQMRGAGGGGGGSVTQAAPMFSAAEHMAAGSPSKKQSSVRSKYRPQDIDPAKLQQQLANEEEDELGANIMFDRRVVRGNTYAAQVITQGAQREAQRLRGDHERAMRAEALRRRVEAERRMQPRTPPAVQGRAHMDVQTDDFLEELTDRPVETEAATQTDVLLDKPPLPLFVPDKSGIDADTQVDVGELFDFDLEVAPILEVLVGKTLELSMLEVLEEEELAAVRRRQRAFITARDAELAEVQRLEAEARRRLAEKQRRLKQAQEHRAAQEAAREKVAARSFARHYLTTLNADVFDGLEAEGHFYDPLRREVSTVFLPWLTDSVAAGVTAAVTARAAVDGLLREATVRGLAVAAAAAAAKEQALKDLAEQRRVAAEAAAAAAAAEVQRLVDEAAAAAAAEAAELAAEGADAEA